MSERAVVQRFLVQLALDLHERCHYVNAFPIQVPCRLHQRLPDWSCFLDELQPRFGQPLNASPRIARIRSRRNEFGGLQRSQGLAHRWLPDPKGLSKLTDGNRSAFHQQDQDANPALLEVNTGVLVDSTRFTVDPLGKTPESRTDPRACRFW